MSSMQTIRSHQSLVDLYNEFHSDLQDDGYMEDFGLWKWGLIASVIDHKLNPNIHYHRYDSEYADELEQIDRPDTEDWVTIIDFEDFIVKINKNDNDHLYSQLFISENSGHGEWFEYIYPA